MRAVIFEQDRGTVSPYALPRELAKGISDQQAIKCMKGSMMVADVCMLDFFCRTCGNNLKGSAHSQRTK